MAVSRHHMRGVANPDQEVGFLGRLALAAVHLLSRIALPSPGEPVPDHPSILATLNIAGSHFYAYKKV